MSNSPTNFFDPLGLDKKNSFDRAKDLARCAASLSQADSINGLSGKNIPLVGGNVVGDLAGLVTGSAESGGEQLDQGAAVALEGFAVPVLEHATGQLAIGTFTSISTPVSYAASVYNPIAVAETSASLGGSAVAGGLLEIFSGIAEAKLIYDTGIFVGAFAVCGFF